MKLLLPMALLAILLGGGALGWYYWNGDVSTLVQQSTDTAQQIAKQAGNLLPLAREIITPPPLRGPTTQQQVTLTSSGVFTFTNQQRNQNGVSSLQRNTTLDQAATNKMNDLFARQYFEHESPTGEGPGDVVDAVHYSYVRVGENLALGNFSSDEALVQAWMDSPGHRANILDSGFQEIGIAVGQGVFEGNQTWIAVQTFATPLSACTSPDTDTKAAITTNEATIDSLQNELVNLQTEFETKEKQANEKIAAGNEQTQKGNDVYRDTGSSKQAQPYWDNGETLQQEGNAIYAEAETARNTYNAKVSTVNALITTTKSLVDAYNTEVQAFNACVKNLEK